MSQEKVERRKKEKENRKKIMKQAKIKSLATKCAVALVIVVAFGWIGYSGYSVIQSNKPVEEVSVNLDSINNYIAGLSTDTAQ
jgi:cell division septal protein FtsQ